jgi:hypothetical protein
MTDEPPTSFDALAHEHNLSGRLRDLCRIFFRAGLLIGRRQENAIQGPVRPYHAVLDRDTTPGEFR